MTIAVVQSAADDAGHPNASVVVLGAAPTIGNALIAMCTQSSQDCTFSFSQGSWSQIAAVQVRPGSGEWPIRYYRCVVSGSMSATTTVSKSGGGNTMKACIVEISSAGAVVFQTSVSVQNTTGQSCTASITPTSARNAILLSCAMNGWTQDLTPASGMTQLHEMPGADGLPVQWNYRLAQPASGSYTIGSTGNDTTSGMLGVSLLEPLPTPSAFGILL